MSVQPPSIETLLGMVSGMSPDMDALARQAAALMADPRSKPADQRPVTMTRRQATVTAVDLGPPLTADVELNGETIPGASPQRTYRPIVGDEVWLEFHGAEAHISPPVTSEDNFGWTALTLAGAWVTFSVWNVPLAYHRDSAGFVHLRGSVSSGAGGSTIATLPAGFRPATASGFGVTAWPTNSTREAAFIAINATTGDIAFAGTTAPYQVPLDGITFRID